MADADLERPTLTRRDVLAFRWRAQGLDAEPGSVRDLDALPVLDLGVQDTGGDGALWALVARGLAAQDDDPWAGLALAWTLRGAPHAYRRRDLADVAVATSPFSPADAAKRVFDAARPLRAAGVPVLDSLREIAALERELVAEPTVKGELSTRLTPLLRPEQVRWCNPCQATHSWEMPFRLAALHAGLELEPGTSPPVLRRAPGLAPAGFARTAADAEPRFDVVRAYLRLFGPATVREIAAYVDAPPRDVEAHRPDDAVEVAVADVEPTRLRGRPEPRWMLADDPARARAAGESSASDSDARAGRVHLLGPFDPYLQLRDRATLVPDTGRQKDLWRTLGRPGALASGGEVLGTWRPRTSGRRLTVRVEPWAPLDAVTWAAVDEDAERLAAFRGVTLAGVERG
ncbi:DNA glycosylase AlkZ-like family protein [Luteimicrobium sp. DT211]|uniref:DNA glycosylase AlkZ-like family protein n=1 Tax=Luteimicrobium sp. DT211 TaxID=3393412 RepID=UPI003CFBBD1A